MRSFNNMMKAEMCWSAPLRLISSRHAKKYTVSITREFVCVQTFPFFGVVPAILNESGEELEGPSEGYLVSPVPHFLLDTSSLGFHTPSLLLKYKAQEIRFHPLLTTVWLGAQHALIPMIFQPRQKHFFCIESAKKRALSACCPGSCTVHIRDLWGIVSLYSMQLFSRLQGASRTGW